MSANERAHTIGETSNGCAPCTECDVVDYLKQNPSFFQHNADLLCDLEVPHLSGAAVSLVERQVALLRERNIEARHRLVRIVEAARNNDRLFEKTRQLVLQMLESESNEQLIEQTRAGLTKELEADFCALKFFCEHETEPKSSDAVLAGLVERLEPVCGQLDEEPRTLLFEQDAQAIESAVVVPLIREGKLTGVLAVGSSDAAHFNRNIGTVFLSFIADVLVRQCN